MMLARFLAPSVLDSRRFGLRVVRGGIPPGAPGDAALRDIQALAPDVAIFRCAAGDTGQADSLRRNGFTPLHADTLLHYRAELTGPGPDVARVPGEDLGRARAAESEQVKAVARAGFAGYRSHYHANPRFDPERVLEGYAEWAAAYAEPGIAGVEAWVARLGGRVVGFASCRPDARASTAEILLNAVHPDHAGRGVYARIVAMLMREYRNAGIGAISVSTQAWNSRVQRAWVRLGFLPDHALDTYHVNLPRGEG